MVLHMRVHKNSGKIESNLDDQKPDDDRKNALSSLSAILIVHMLLYSTEGSIFHA